MCAAMPLIADVDSDPALMLTSPGDIFRWWIRKASPRAGPMTEEKPDLSFISSHYIGYIPLEFYQTALRSDSPSNPSQVAGRILIDQIQG